MKQIVTTITINDGTNTGRQITRTTNYLDGEATSECFDWVDGGHATYYEWRQAEKGRYNDIDEEEFELNF